MMTLTDYSGYKRVTNIPPVAWSSIDDAAIKGSQPFGLRAILEWAVGKNLVAVGPGGFYGWAAIVSFQ